MLHNESRELLLKAWDKTHDAKKVAEFFDSSENAFAFFMDRS